MSLRSRLCLAWENLPSVHNIYTTPECLPSTGLVSTQYGTQLLLRLTKPLRVFIELSQGIYQEVATMKIPSPGHVRPLLSVLGTV